MLMGGSGTGKTTSAKTLIRSGVEVLALFTEPRWKPLSHITCSEGFHLHYIPPTTSSFDDMIQRYRTATQMPWDALTKMVDNKKRNYTAFVEVLETVHEFKCDRCEKVFGDVTELGPSFCFWHDGLSGINPMSMSMFVGGAVARSQPQWGAAMGAELDLINTLCYKTKCWFVLVTHIERLVDEIEGGMIIQANALGRKNAPELPKNFDDVILAERRGKTFVWSMVKANVDTKPTFLPLEDALPQDFSRIKSEWEKGIPTKMAKQAMNATA
jgi:hypothetical protein